MRKGNAAPQKHSFCGCTCVLRSQCALRPVQDLTRTPTAAHKCSVERGVHLASPPFRENVITARVTSFWWVPDKFARTSGRFTSHYVHPHEDCVVKTRTTTIGDHDDRREQRFGNGDFYVGPVFQFLQTYPRLETSEGPQVEETI